MKNQYKIVMLIFFLVYFVGTVNQNIIMSNAEIKSASSESRNYEEFYVHGEDSEYRKKYMNMKVISVSKKKIKIKIENTGDKTYRDFGQFVLKKYERNKWRKLKFKKSVAVKKGWNSIPANSSDTIIIKWKNYYNNNLKKGKYKIIYEDIGTQKFRVK